MKRQPELALSRMHAGQLAEFLHSDHDCSAGDIAMLTPLGLHGALASAAQPIIEDVLQFGGPGVAKPSNEPTAVAAIVWVAVGAIAKAWHPILKAAGFSIAAQGVFCHGSPQVTFSDAVGAIQRCELADLLLVVDEQTAGLAVDRRATLVQAKLFSTGVISLSGTDLHQLDLLSRWPQFRFMSRLYNPASRDFKVSGQPGRADESGRYGGIDLVSAPPFWEQFTPSRAMKAKSGLELATILEGMALGTAAMGREAIVGGNDDWSMTIDELLTVTFRQSVRLAASIGAGSRPRGVSALVKALAVGPNFLAGPKLNRLTEATLGGGPVEPGPEDRLPSPEVDFLLESDERR